MTAKYTVIDSQVLSTSATSVTFSSIPSGYKDLVVVCDLQANTVTDIVPLTTVNASSTGYNSVYARGNGSIATSGKAASSSSINAYLEVSNASKTSLRIDIMDYAKTDKHKSFLFRNDRADFMTAMLASRWANTTAITSVTVAAAYDAWAAGSTFRLLGVN